MAEVKLIAYEREFKFVGVCTCGKRWNLPEQKVRKATIADAKEWLLQQSDIEEVHVFYSTKYNSESDPAK